MNKKIMIGVITFIAIMGLTGCKITHKTKDGDETTVEWKAGQSKTFSTVIEFDLDGSEDPYSYDVSRVSFPISYSNAQLTGATSLKISVYNHSGQRLYSRYFSSSLNNGVVIFDSPALVNSWLSSKVSNSNIVRYDVELGVGYKVSNNVGSTAVITAEVKYDNSSYGGRTDAGVIMPSLGPTCNPDTGICYQVP
ncbi:MAG TPA: hypothetical protein VIM93_03315 [Kangiella sp.]